MTVVNANIETAKSLDRVDFNKANFDLKVDQKGLNILWQRAMICPCRKDVSSQATSDCINCNGYGWYYLTGVGIKAMISGAALQRIFPIWTENLQGTAMMTVESLYKIGWMDKITVLNGKSVFSETKDIVVSGDEKYVDLRYNISSVKGVYKYIGNLTSLSEITSTNYSIDDTVDYRLNITGSTNVAGDNVSVLYEYNPVYLIIDILNDYRNSYVKVGNTEQLKEFPIRAMIKKAHLVLQQ